MSEQTLEARICEVMGVHPKKRETREKFLARAATAAADENILTTEAYDALPEALQGWVNDAVKATTDGTEIPEFPTDDDAGGEADGAAEGDEAGTEEAAPPKKATKKAKAAKAPKPEKDDMSGTLAVGKAIMVKNMGISVEDLVKALEKKGHNASRSTAMTIRYTFRHSVMVLKNLGVDVKQLEL